MGGRGPYGDGANRFEPTRTGPLENLTRRTADAFDAESSSGRCPECKPHSLLSLTSALHLHTLQISPAGYSYGL